MRFTKGKWTQFSYSKFLQWHGRLRYEGTTNNNCFYIYIYYGQKLYSVSSLLHHVPYSVTKKMFKNQFLELCHTSHFICTLHDVA